MIVGTAGHIDHGKTALVRALTGIDTDRLPEEKRRGITIELGFAPLALPGGVAASVVDVPGHEALVRTMVAGATGFDVALLVIAADDGVMPQTREHLAILDLLGVRRGVVALTKCDLVDAEWRALVTADVRELLDASALREAAIVDVSSVTGEGIEALRHALAAALITRGATRKGSGAEQPAAGASMPGDPFRLPIDRAFTVKGTGTVVTGTVWSGSVARDDLVRILPSGRTARVRGIHSHGAAQELAAPGRRTALSLAGIDLADVARGESVTAGDGWRPATALRADVSLLIGVHTRIGPRTRLRLHLGTSEVGTRLLVAGHRLEAGETRPARLVLDAPVVTRAGDRFVLRGGARLSTLGGGIVTDPYPAHRRARPWPRASAAAHERLAWLLADASDDGLAVSDLCVQLGVRAHALDAFLAAEVQARRVVRSGARVQDHARARAAAQRAASEAARRSAGPPSPEIEADRHWLLERLLAAGATPPTGPELADERGHAVLPALRQLEREGAARAVERDRWYDARAFDRVLDALEEALANGAERTPAELRDIVGSSRKYLVPLLEYCDRQGYTLRTATGRTAGPALTRRKAVS